MTDIELQPIVFLSCLGAGLVAGLVYAALYLVRRRCRFARLAETLADAAFVLISAGLYFVVLYLTGYGKMRLYTVAAFVGGFAVVYSLLSPLKARLPAMGSKIRALCAKHLERRKK